MTCFPKWPCTGPIPNLQIVSNDQQKQFKHKYSGGPNLYTEEHGHPMMKARHMPLI